MSDPFDAADTTDTDTDTTGVADAGEAAERTHEPVADQRLDLDGIERDLADVELALARLDSGEYWTDEVTGAPIPDEHLAEHPTARRLADR
jgi:RNA polymerase-binding transcription factor DksA